MDFMDPIANINEQRAIAQRLRSDRSYDNWDADMHSGHDQDVNRLVELVLALDERQKGDPALPSEERFVIRWDGPMGCYRVSDPNIAGPLELVSAANYDRLKDTTERIEKERIALADAWRAQLEGVGVPAVTAANIIQDVIDRASEE